MTAALLCGGGDQLGVLLDLAGNAHVHVLVANRYDHAANEGGVDARRQLDGLLGLDEFLCAATKSDYFTNTITKLSHGAQSHLEHIFQLLALGVVQRLGGDHLAYNLAAVCRHDRSE